MADAARKHGLTGTEIDDWREKFVAGAENSMRSHPSRHALPLALDMKPDDSVFGHSTFSKNRDRFHAHGLMQAFLDGTVAKAIQEQATSDEHFSVDGTLIQSMASLNSCRSQRRRSQGPAGFQRLGRVQG